MHNRSTVSGQHHGSVFRRSARTDGRGGGLYGYGKAVVIYHPDEQLYSFFAHMREAFVAEGMEVYAGEPIGIIGATTNGKFPGMGRHLHMEVRRPKPDGRAWPPVYPPPS